MKDQVDIEVKVNDSLTAILIEDKNLGGYAGYFKEFPDLLTQGESKNETVENLIQALPIVLQSFFGLVNTPIISKGFQIA